MGILVQMSESIKNRRTEPIESGRLDRPTEKMETETMMKKEVFDQEPAIGFPYYVGVNPYQTGLIPPNAIFGDPKGVPIHQTIFRDSPAPFSCLHCGRSGVTSIKSKPSLASVVGCMMPMMLGICFLCPSMDCLWHKYHYCPSCNEKVAEFEKSDPCLVVDPPQWTQESFALPA